MSQTSKCTPMDDARGITLWMVVQRKASTKNYIADDDGCGDIDSGKGGSCGRVPSENTRPRRTPTPSNTPSKIPQATADPKAAFGPLRAAKQPPVMKPEIMAFHASSFCRNPFTAQSNVENMPPQTPKLPPVTGARAFIVEREPAKRSPRGEFLAPFMPCQIPPPTAPMAKAPPKSLRITHGQGSRV